MAEESDQCPRPVRTTCGSSTCAHRSGSASRRRVSHGGSPEGAVAQRAYEIEVRREGERSSTGVVASP